jgi:ABC-type sugar transport system ATPase subunit
MNEQYILEMENITKYIFNAKGKAIHGSHVRILDKVSFNLEKGEVHALLGENGAGKSTLMKILGGIIPQDEGRMLIDGKEVLFRSPREARASGVAFIHQEINLCANISVARNMFLGNEPKRSLNTLDFAKMNRLSREMIRGLGYDVDPGVSLGSLSTAHQQIVEIAKALSYDSRIIIMDEPTSSLTEKEITMLFELIGKLKAKGVSIIYISHRLEEIHQIGDRITVLRDGALIGTLDRSEYSDEKAIRMIAGRTLKQMYTNTHKPTAEVVLELKDFRIGAGTQPLSMFVRAGEVVGLCGLVGSGRTELAKSIFGARDFASGEIFFRGKRMANLDPFRCIEMGMVYLSEDRKTEGLIVDQTVRENIVVACLRRLFRNGVVAGRKERGLASQMIQRFNIICRGQEHVVNKLSGGNQQKVSFAKAYAPEPNFIILDEPTRGIDVGAKSEIYKIMDETAARGVGILMISSEMHELVGMSDRIYVMRDGTIVGEVSDKSKMDQGELIALCIGADLG